MSQKITKNLTANDLRGCIENYPIDLVELMITRAKESCATYNNTKEILDILESCPNLAFDWRKTPEGHDFWLDVIVNNNFKVFFDLYPNNCIEPECVYVIQDGTYNASDVIKTLESYGGINSNNVIGSAKDCIYFIMPISATINWVKCGIECDYNEFLKALNYKKVDIKASRVEISKADIIAAFNLDPHVDIVITD